MNDSCARGRVERLGQVGGDPGGLPGVEPPLARQPLSQAFAGDLVHHVIEQVARGAGGMDRHDVRMPQAGDGARLGEEPARDGRVGGQLGVDNLDRDGAIEGGIDGAEDDAHAPPPQLLAEPVLRAEGGLQGGKGISRGVRHGFAGSGEREANIPIRRAGHTCGGFGPRFGLNTS